MNENVDNITATTLACGTELARCIIAEVIGHETSDHLDGRALSQSLLSELMLQELTQALNKREVVYVD